MKIILDILGIIICIILAYGLQLLFVGMRCDLDSPIPFKKVKILYIIPGLGFLMVFLEAIFMIFYLAIDMMKE